MKSTQSRGSVPSVVIVEDDRELANLFAVSLGRYYEVRVAHSCEEAYGLFDETVDVVLLDRRLPDGSGDDVLREIRNRGFDFRVAMVTSETPTLEIVEMDFDEYLKKPVTHEELHSTVERLVAQRNYGDVLAELYAIVSKKILLETHCSSMELVESEEYASLRARFEELHDEFVGMRRTLSEVEVIVDEL